jgi:hypothetical protein
MSRQLQLELADFATDHCATCAGSSGQCEISRRVAKCLKSEGLIIGAFRDTMFTVRNDYPITDWRHYVFERVTAAVDKEGTGGFWRVY